MSGPVEVRIDTDLPRVYLVDPATAPRLTAWLQALADEAAAARARSRANC